MSLEPAGYNETDFEKNRVRTKCACGWATKWRRPGKPPKGSFFEPFRCPTCDKKLSNHTSIR